VYGDCGAPHLTGARFCYAAASSKYHEILYLQVCRLSVLISYETELGLQEV
jgi:hypothetical protein